MSQKAHLMSQRLHVVTALALTFILLCSCREEIDTSARYVFKDETISSYLQKHSEYSQYAELLGRVPCSGMSESTVGQLLSARGHFTVFAPTNDAIDKYLQELVTKGLISEPTWDAFPTERMRDSIRQVIVLNSVIDGGNERYYQTHEFPENDAEFPLPNMRDIRLRSIFQNDTLYINREFPIDDRNQNIPTINGMIHQMHRVVAPSEQTLADILAEYLSGRRQGFRVMAMLCDVCGLMDTLSARRDEEYEKLYLAGQIEQKTPANGLATMDGGFSYAPEHRKYAFTIFAEPDSFWEEQLGRSASEITPADVLEWVVAKGYYPEGKADTKYTDEKNVLYQWTTYHVLPFKLAPDRLVLHYNERGYEITQPYR
ncbi:MAG: fasciclin domain-containing protein, partial [Bacteroidaceae bacterium]|nr:fasciclin domain-containing protein [Bacteroidaceae bacterium]